MEAEREGDGQVRQICQHQQPTWVSLLDLDRQYEHN